MRIAGILMAAALAVCAQAGAGEGVPGGADAVRPQPRVGAGMGSGSGEAGCGAAHGGAPVKAASAEKVLEDGAFGAAVPALRLAALRGGADTVSNDMRLSGAVSGNTALNVASGMNTISSGSFSNASGLPVAIQNSGANVLIQNATIINIQLQ